MPNTFNTGEQMLANRLQKNLRTLGRWAQREQIQCYRLYDADIPEYALAIDIYEGKQRWVHAQEYQAPKQIAPEKTRRRLQEALHAIPETLDIPPQQLFLKVRKQQKGCAQYEKLASSGEFHEVLEAGNRFLVNFRDYLDTGLFLDHRITRGMLAKLAAGRDFLNLFAYTGSGSVYAASGGARTTTTVDMSKTYLDWAQRNMALNNFNGFAHRFIQANCLDWLDRASRKSKRYGLIFLDPPSFSASKRMQGSFDVQRDYIKLVGTTARLLTDDGILVFSNNLRRFRMDSDAFPALHIRDISRKTLPKDFERNPRIHQCWEIRRANAD